MTAHVQPPLTEALEEARRRLVDVLGSQAVLADQELVREFYDPYAAVEDVRHRPGLVVQPADVAEVQEILRTAADLDIPVWPTSQGRNYGYGGAAPVVDGSIVLNLPRMNRILEIDEHGGYAVIEPGVSFFDLYAEIKRRGLKLWISVPDLGWGSVVGNALEHGLGYTVQGDHAAAISGMEVVLPDGEVLRTGQWAHPGSSLGARHKRGFGPALDGLFMQSGMGVVTKVGIWLMPEPQTFTTGSVICHREEDVEALVDALAPLVQDGTIQGQPLLVSSPEPEGGRATPDQDTSGMTKQQQLSAAFPPGRWDARVSFYGHPSLVAAREQILREAVAGIPGVTVELRHYAGDVDPEAVHPLDLVPAGIPNMFLLDMIHEHLGEGVGHVDFSPVIPFTGADAARHEAKVQQVLTAAGLVGGFGWIAGPRSLVGVCMVFFDTADDAEREAAFTAVSELVDWAHEQGWIEYRAHPRLVQKVVDGLSFNDGAQARILTRIKDALDPASILAPGNHGVWPSRYLPTAAEGDLR